MINLIDKLNFNLNSPSKAFKIFFYNSFNETILHFSRKRIAFFAKSYSCGNLDGEITSTVEGTEIPVEDNQSNFGSGFGYQYGTDDTIEIFMNEKWFIFEYREESE